MQRTNPHQVTELVVDRDTFSSDMAAGFGAVIPVYPVWLILDMRSHAHTYAQGSAPQHLPRWEDLSHGRYAWLRAKSDGAVWRWHTHTHTFSSPRCLKLEFKMIDRITKFRSKHNYCRNASCVNIPSPHFWFLRKIKLAKHSVYLLHHSSSSQRILFSSLIFLKLNEIYGIVFILIATELDQQ